MSVPVPAQGLLDDPKTNWCAEDSGAVPCEGCGDVRRTVAHHKYDIYLVPPDRCWDCRKGADDAPTLGDAKAVWTSCGAGEALREQASDLGSPPEPLARVADPRDELRGVYLHGTTGAGKTTLALAVVRHALIEAARAGRDLPQVRYARLPDVMAAARDAFEGGTWSWGPYKTADLLVLDDLGAADRATEWAMEVRDALVNARYESSGATIWTGQSPPSGLRSEVWPDRLVRRIYDTIEANDTTHLYHMSRDHTLTRHDPEEDTHD